MIRIIILCLLTLIGLNPAKRGKSDDTASTTKVEKPKIAFSFDDGSTEDMPNYSLVTWNEMLLNSLKKNHLKAVLFATGSRLQSEKGDYVLHAWDQAGHKIANHTYSHNSITDKTSTLEEFEKDMLRNDTIVRKCANFYPYFRFPYLKEGDTEASIRAFRLFLLNHAYKTGHVTIDASDWYVNSRLIKRLKTDPTADISGYRAFYLEHLLERATFYDSLASVLTNRKIAHVILLHHNLAAALFLDDLIVYLKAKGWEVMDTEEAYKDPIYQTLTTRVPAGESLIWALAKQSGRFENILRYPGEDGDYEKPKMDKLGL